MAWIEAEARELLDRLVGRYGMTVVSVDADEGRRSYSAILRNGDNWLSLGGSARDGCLTAGLETRGESDGELRASILQTLPRLMPVWVLIRRYETDEAKLKHFQSPYEGGFDLSSPHSFLTALTIAVDGLEQYAEPYLSGEAPVPIWDRV